MIAFWFFWQSQISVLQNRIEQLEQLLEENHEIISHIKDSVLELTANVEGPPALLPYTICPMAPGWCHQSPDPASSPSPLKTANLLWGSGARSQSCR